MRKIYIVPNLVTTANMGAGFYAVIASTQGDFVAASWAIMIAAVFDSLDGRIARMARATSQFGVQYDSLSDLISFGFAPAFLLYQAAYAPYGRLGMIAAFLFLVCGALRLARFNVTASHLPSDCFQGLPSPAAAGSIATFMIFQNDVEIPFDTRPVLMVMGIVVGLLMVSTIRFSSFKSLNWRSKTSFPYWLTFVVAIIFIILSPEVTLFLISALYVVGSLVWNLVRWPRGHSPVVKAQSPDHSLSSKV